MSNDPILPFSRRKTKSSVIGLPGKLPETFVATIVFPSRSTERVLVLFNGFAPPRDDVLQPFSCAAFVSYDAIARKACGQHFGLAGVLGGQEAFNGFRQMYRPGFPLVVVGLRPSLPPLRMVISLPNGKNACPAAARYVR